MNIRALKETAYHEAGHAIAKMVLTKHSYSFECVLIRPEAHVKGAIVAPHVDRRGREVHCLGITEGPAIYNPKGFTRQYVRTLDAQIKSMFEDCMKRQIIYAMAGPYAQLNYIGMPYIKSDARWAIWLDGGSSDDNLDVALVMKDLWALNRTRPSVKLMNATQTLVQANWPAIDTLAKALLERNTLEYDDAYTVVEPHLSPEIKIVARPSDISVE